MTHPNGYFPLKAISVSSMVTNSVGVEFFRQFLTNIPKSSLIGASLSTSLPASLVVSSSNRKQHKKENGNDAVTLPI